SEGHLSRASSREYCVRQTARRRAAHSAVCGTGCFHGEHLTYVCCSDGWARIQDCEPLHDIRKLTHVPRPAIAREKLQSVVRPVRWPLPRSGAVQGGEVPHEESHAARTFA